MAEKINPETLLIIKIYTFEYFVKFSFWVSVPCSTQLSMKFIMLIHVKMPTVVGFLTFISMINTTTEGLKASTVFLFQHISFYKQLKFDAQLS